MESKILLKKTQSYEYKIISMALARALRGTEVEHHTFCGKSISVWEMVYFIKDKGENISTFADPVFL